MAAGTMSEKVGMIRCPFARNKCVLCPRRMKYQQRGPAHDVVYDIYVSKDRPHTDHTKSENCEEGVPQNIQVAPVLLYRSA